MARVRFYFEVHPCIHGAVVEVPDGDIGNDDAMHDHWWQFLVKSIRDGDAGNIEKEISTITPAE